MKEPLLLMALQRQIGRIQIEDNLRGRDRVRLQEHVDQQTVDGCGVAGYFLVAGDFLHAEFQAVQGAFSRQRGALIGFSRRGSKQRIVAQAVVIVQIFIAQGEADDPL